MARRGKKQPIQINSVADKMKAEGQCRLCGRLNRGSGARELTKHRLVPGRFGGEYIVANVIPLCRRCHDDVEAQDPVARRMLRPKLWPLEVAHAIKKLSQEWFDLMYPKPAMPSVRMNKIEELLELPVQKPRESRQTGEDWSYTQALIHEKLARKKRLKMWDPDLAQIASSEKSSARRRGMRTATTRVA